MTVTLFVQYWRYPRENAYKQNRKIPYRQKQSPPLRNILGYLKQLFIFSDFQMSDFPIKIIQYMRLLFPHLSV